MTWKRLCNDWTPLTVALGLCVGAFLVRRMAWHAGLNANALGLLGCHFLRSVLLLLAWATVITILKTTAKKEKLPATSGFTVLDTFSALLLFPGCVGCYPIWPMVLVLLTFQLLLTPRLSPADDRPSPRAVLHAALNVLLFTLTWYLCASTTRQAVNGLGERIETRCGSDRLLAWAAEVIATYKPKEQVLPVFGATTVGLMASPQGHGALLAAAALGSGRNPEEPPRLARHEIPDWVDDLLGPFQGIRSIDVERYGADPCVSLRTGGSAYHFRIRVCPGHARHESRPWWLGAVDGSEWRPGIHVETEGK